MNVLSAVGMSAGYAGHPIVRDFSLDVAAGQVVAILGPNGAGKTTTLSTLAGAIPPLAGTVTVNGHERPATLHGRARRGLGFISEDRSVFMDLTTEENLRVGRCDVAMAMELFPELAPLARTRAGLLSGGEQQMLTLARALARRPTLILIDELSLGLAPLVVHRLLTEVRRAADETGMGVVLVEQHITQALRWSDEAVVLRRGEVTLRGPAAGLLERAAEIRSAYLTHDEPAAAS